MVDINLGTQAGRDAIRREWRDVLRSAPGFAGDPAIDHGETVL